MTNPKVDNRRSSEMLEPPPRALNPEIHSSPRPDIAAPNSGAYGPLDPRGNRAGLGSPLSLVWNFLQSPETDLQPDFYKLEITLGRSDSVYKNIIVTEPMISTLVGLETYKALNFRWPELYWPLNVKMTPRKAYLDLVDSIGSSSNIEMSDFGRVVKMDLVRMTVDGGDTQGVAGALVSSSLSTRHFDVPLRDRLFSTIWSVIWIIVTLYVLCRMGFVESLLYPKYTERVIIS